MAFLETTFLLIPLRFNFLFVGWALLLAHILRQMGTMYNRTHWLNENGPQFLYLHIIYPIRRPPSPIHPPCSTVVPPIVVPFAPSAVASGVYHQWRYSTQAA
jgi:hypothetical protein